MGAEVETYCSWRRFPAGRHETTREKKSPFLGFALTQRQKRKTRVRMRRETLTGREREAASQGPPGPGRDSSQAMQRRSFWGKRLKGGPSKAGGGACEQRARGTGLASTLPARAPVVTSGTRRPPHCVGPLIPSTSILESVLGLGKRAKGDAVLPRDRRWPGEGEGTLPSARLQGLLGGWCPASSGRGIETGHAQEAPRGLTSDHHHWTTRDAAPREMPLKQRAFQK